MRYIISERQYKLLSEQPPETIMDRRGASIQKLSKDLGNLSFDDTVDIISAVFDTVPGIGNVISLGIDALHGISYIIRFVYSETTEEQIENGSMAIITLGTSYLPVGGNAASILMRKGIKDVLRYTPSEIMMLGQKLGLVDRTRIFLSKKVWKYSLLLLLAKIFRSELSECIVVIVERLNQIYEKIKNVNGMKTISGYLLTFISLLEELSNDSDFAVKLVEVGKM